MDAINLKHHFGLKLLQKLCKDEKNNFVFSPLSLGTAFAMLSAGLKGETKSELLTFLGGEDEEALHELYAGLVADKELPLRIANKYLADHRIKVAEEYGKLLETKYESEVQTVDFVSEGRQIEKEVNSWVSEKTNNMITNLLQENSLTPDTILVLLNAVYFKGTWIQEFEPVPMKLDFTLRDGTVVKKDFITKTSKNFKYHETDKLRLVKVPYNEGGCYMILAQPIDENKHIDDVLMEITPSDMASAIEQLATKRGPPVDLTLPKFKIEYVFGNVKSHMQQLGVKKIFTAGTGDFGDMFASSEVEQKICVGTVIHRAVIELDEMGTEAAAATAITMAMSCSFAFEEANIIFKLNKPFAFWLMTNNHTTSFVGKDRAVCITDLIHRSVIEVDEIGTQAAAATAMVMTRCLVLNEDFLCNRPFYFGVYAGSKDICLFEGIFRV